jgi:hypothetical protein
MHAHSAPPKDAEPIFVDTPAAAKILNVSASFLNKLRVTGGGPQFQKFGAHVRYNVKALLAWADAQSRKSTSDQREVA